MLKYYFFLIGCLFGCCHIGCQGETKPTTTITAEEPALATDETAKMVKRLKEITGNLDPMKITYFSNGYRASVYESKASQSQNLNEQLSGLMLAGYELLNGGQNEEAIVKLSSLLQQLEGKVDNPDILLKINKLIALAYIRLGEQNNCIDRSNDESCIIPIQGKGIYAMTSATNTAIGIYKDMLAKNPKDTESIWMLNFAYMTLGEYPEKVPAQFRLPPSFFKSDIEIPKFSNIASAAGLSTIGLSGGTIMDDFNNDGKLDIVASSWGFNDQLRIFFNQGDNKFREATKEAGITGITGGLNINQTDYNNDGFLDILVLRGAWLNAEGKIPNSLLKNNGDGTFTDVTESSGLLTFAPTQTAAWADFNRDGHIDLFIGNESGSEAKFPCEFYLNNGNGTFSNQTVQLGLQNLMGMVKGVTVGDVNNDGNPDIYISILGSNNYLLLNKGAQNGQLVFENITENAGVGEPVNSFPTWFWDYNNDGWQDILVTSFGDDLKNKPNPAGDFSENALGRQVGSHPRVYRNNQDGTFTEKSKEMGMNEAVFAMGSNYGDIDNDGFSDIYFGTGAPSFTAIVPNKMFRNNEGRTFQDVTTAGRVGHIQKGHGVGFGDIDNDGDQDIFCVLGGAFEGDVFGDALFLNPYGNKNNWVTLRLVGTESNKAAIGARVKITVENKSGKTQVIHGVVSSGGSFGGNSLQLETGLNDAVQIKHLEITWPNAQLTKQIFENLEINTIIKITENKTAPVYLK